MSLIPGIDDGTLYIIGYFAAMIAVFGYLFSRNRGKLLARIKTPLGEEKYHWAKPTRDGKHIIIRKPKRGVDTGWKAAIEEGSVMTHKAYFGLKTIKTVDILPESLKTIRYVFTPEGVEQPVLTAEEAAKINATDGFRRRYGDKPQGVGGNWLIYGILLVGIIVLILELRGQGIIKF